MSNNEPGPFRRWKEGDPDSLNPLLCEYLPRVKGIVRAQLGHPLRSRLESDDILQEAVHSFLKLLPHFEVNDEEHFVNLLSRLVRNAICARYHYFSAERRDFLRERELTTGCEARCLSALLNGSRPPSEQLANAEAADEILAHILVMDSDDQDVVVMRLDGLQYRQMAELLGTTAEAARKRYVRALRKLVESIESGRRAREDAARAQDAERTQQEN
ncbi:MAG: sigma-70 family RNA polymerase sigma factor [Planctomycetota bacterium]